MPNSMKKTRNDVGEGEPAMTEYEKQRALRIKRNMERMKALDLPSMASSLNREFCYKEMKGENKASRKATKDKDDDEDEYQPTSEDDDDEEEDEEEKEDEEEEEENNKREKRKKVVNSSKKTRVRTSKCPQRDEKVGNAEEIDEDAALQKGNGRPKMSEDDVISYFFLIDAKSDAGFLELAAGLRLIPISASAIAVLGPIVLKFGGKKHRDVAERMAPGSLKSNGPIAGNVAGNRDWSAEMLDKTYSDFSSS
ncbi:hypothetical protein EJ110_NYTH28654 [Nymphaea thermarum]|nr:hypothetical protein EJ110_NYTH28654 [Nymphaea thermarum]